MSQDTPMSIQAYQVNYRPSMNNRESVVVETVIQEVDSSFENQIAQNVSRTSSSFLRSSERRDYSYFRRGHNRRDRVKYRQENIKNIEKEKENSPIRFNSNQAFSLNKNASLEAEQKADINQSPKRVSKIETPKSESISEFNADVNEFSSHSSRREKLGFGPFSKEEDDFIKGRVVYKRENENSPSKVSRDTEQKHASPLRRSKVEETKVQNYQNVDSTPKKKPKQKDKTTTNTHFRTNKIRNSSKKIKRPQSERKKSKPRPQNPYDEKSKPQRYHINILTPGKLKPKKNKSNTKSVLKTTATTKKSNINSDTMLGNPYTYSASRGKLKDLTQKRQKICPKT